MSEWIKLSPEERQARIDEIEKWLRFRYSGRWFENMSVALLQEIYDLRAQINELKTLKSQDP